jgi:hypothetical protein
MTRSHPHRYRADHLGHSKVSMTQDVYMTRGKVHTQVADLLDAAIRRINGPSELACPRKLALMKCAVRVSNPGPAD